MTRTFKIIFLGHLSELVVVPRLEYLLVDVIRSVFSFLLLYSLYSCKQYIVYSLQCTVYSVQCTVYSLQSTVYSLQSTVYSLQSIFNGIHSTSIIYGLNSVVYNLYSSICWYLPSLWVFTDFMSGHDSIAYIMHLLLYNPLTICPSDLPPPHNLLLPMH